VISGPPPSEDVAAATRQRRRLPAAQRRQLVLDAALRTFAANGYDGAAMEQIAAAAGVSKAVVYDHVSSKDELYSMVLDSIRIQLVAVVETALEPARGPGEPRVRAAVAALFGYVEEHPEAARLLCRELQDANHSEIGSELHERLTATLLATLSNEQGLLEIGAERERQLLIFAELLKAAMLGLVVWWFRNPDVAREDLVERLTMVVWPALERAWTPPAS